MSNTSCFNYVLELPLGTLSALLRAVLEEPEAAGSVLTQRWEGVPIPGGYTATVEVRPGDFVTMPPVVTLPLAPLAMKLVLDMRVVIDVNELPELDPIEYGIHFELPGFLAKTAAAPPQLRLGFTGVTQADLNLVLSGGQIALTPALVEARVHDLYDANPALAQDVQNNVPWPPGPDPTVRVTTDVFDDEPGSMPFRGSIAVPSSTATSVTLRMPGHFHVQGLAVPNIVNTDMTVDVVVPVQQSDGELRVRLSQLTANDVSVTFATPPTSPLIDFGAKTVLRNAIANKLKTFAPAPSHDLIQLLPKAADVQATMTERLLAFARALTLPVFSPQPPNNPGAIDLTLFEPATVSGQVLALQFVPLGDGTPCDPPDVFASPTDGFAIAVAAGEVQRMLGPIVDGAKGDRNVEGYDMTVKALSAGLSNPGDHGVVDGHIWIDGTTEVHVDCWADPEVDFAGAIFLESKKQGTSEMVFEAKAGDFTADDPCCADVDPATIANLISGKQSSPFEVPTRFGEVGQIDWTAGTVQISAAGLVVHCDATVTATSSAHGASSAGGSRPYWRSDRPAP
jgi:hypothetical protein